MTRASPELPRPLCSFGHVHSHLAPTALPEPLAVPSSLRQRGIPAQHGNGSDLCSLLDWDQDMDYLETVAHNHITFLEDAEGKFPVCLS